MQVILTSTEKALLEKRHRKERDSRVCDLIKAVLLSSEGWKVKTIAQAMRIRRETVEQHLKDWQQERKLKPENGGSTSKLTPHQTQALEEHLQQQCYLGVKAICAYVFDQFGVTFSVPGMTKWLHAHGFVYKQPKLAPSKVNPAQQAVFIREYNELSKQLPSKEVMVFMDATHPTMATKTCQGWIKKGANKWLKQSASRTRMNIIGAIELDSMTVHSTCVETVNADSTLAFLDTLKVAYPNAPNIHVILDQAGYHRSEKFKQQAESMGIVLHYLPPYSPNLNPIERLWKVMNEQCRNNVFFESDNEFR